MTTEKLIRMSGSNTTEVNFAGRLFSQQADGSFEIPESLIPDGKVAGLVVTPAPAAVPAPTGPLVVALSGSEIVTLDLGDIEVRLRLLELSDWSRIDGRGLVRFTDSAGAMHTLTKPEATNVLAAARRRQHAA